MDSEQRLREKLRKTEALYAGAATAGERAAAGAAAERIRKQFETVSQSEPAEEFKFSIPDLWPEFEELSKALMLHLAEITETIIREEVHEKMRDADEIEEPRKLR